MSRATAVAPALISSMTLSASTPSAPGLPDQPPCGRDEFLDTTVPHVRTLPFQRSSSLRLLCQDLCLPLQRQAQRSHAGAPSEPSGAPGAAATVPCRYLTDFRLSASPSLRCPSTPLRLRRGSLPFALTAKASQHTRSKRNPFSSRLPLARLKAYPAFPFRCLLHMVICSRTPVVSSFWELLKKPRA
ncbi:hypothetical protein Efla_004629 [Eimeria flavescens]